MKEKHSDVHVLMIAALLLVAASAVIQTAIGLQSDKLSAVRSQQMFAAVVASSAASTNPRLLQFVNQTMKVEVNEKGDATLRGVAYAVSGNAVILHTWGGDWRILLSPATKYAGIARQASASAIKPGDILQVKGLASVATPNVVAAQFVYDFTLPQIKGAKLIIPFEEKVISSDSVLTNGTVATNTVNITQPRPEVESPMMKQNTKGDIGVVPNLDARSMNDMKARLQKLME